MDPFTDHIQHWIAGLGWTGEAVVRLGLATILGGLVGIERELRGREAGFRTNSLVCVGSCLAMLISTAFGNFPWTPQGAYNINVDPARIAYGVMTGIGFLGAGAIIKQQLTVRGLTTAAALWCVAAIGMACGFGMYTLGMVTAAMVLMVLWLLDYLEDALPRRRFRMITLRCPWHDWRIGHVVQRIENRGIRVEDQAFRRIDDLSMVDVELFISYTDTGKYAQLEEELHADDSCRLIASGSGDSRRNQGF